jgi:hypothetical protein
MEVPGMAMMPIAAMKQQVDNIQLLMASIMQEGMHYGVIPGTGKQPSLLKPGAEKIAMTFRLVPTFAVRERNHEYGHREYEVTCTITTQSGVLLGQGLGLCSTQEKKYRWRPGPVEFTGKPVPAAYWSSNPRDIKLIGGTGHATKKNPDTGAWEIVIQGASIENPDIADVYNTVLKIAKKRAYVDAILTVTGASDIFTQDVEDMAPEHRTGGNNAVTPPETSTGNSSGSQPTQGNGGGYSNGNPAPASPKQAGYIISLLNGLKCTTDEDKINKLNDVLAELTTGIELGYPDPSVEGSTVVSTITASLTSKQASDVVTALKSKGSA